MAMANVNIKDPAWATRIQGLSVGGWEGAVNLRGVIGSMWVHECAMMCNNAELWNDKYMECVFLFEMMGEMP